MERSKRSDTRAAASSENGEPPVLRTSGQQRCQGWHCTAGFLVCAGRKNGAHGRAKKVLVAKAPVLGALRGIYDWQYETHDVCKEKYLARESKKLGDMELAAEMYESNAHVRVYPATQFNSASSFFSSVCFLLWMYFSPHRRSSASVLDIHRTFVRAPTTTVPRSAFNVPSV